VIDVITLGMGHVLEHEFGDGAIVGCFHRQRAVADCELGDDTGVLGFGLFAAVISWQDDFDALAVGVVGPDASSAAGVTLVHGDAVALA
jgi:hypothetical protein